MKEFLRGAIEAHMEDNGGTKEEAFSAVIEWVMHDLKNMYLEDVEII
jgi:hypothetical protein|tara:strand:- start:6671 stop:6811 length:141 start_codon:yes stop_codon:yes gene_type:complete